MCVFLQYLVGWIWALRLILTLSGYTYRVFLSLCSGPHKLSETFEKK